MSSDINIVTAKEERIGIDFRGGDIAREIIGLNDNSYY